MIDYFSPWRRKLGVIILMMACAVVALWMRSGIVGDFIVFTTKTYPMVSITSRLGVLECAWYDDKLDFRPNAQWSSSRIRREQSDRHPNEAYFFWRGEPDVNSGGRVLHYGTSLAIRYFTIVTPLALLSVWLLLSKPRITKPQMIAKQES